MAIVILGGGVAAASGSVGGVVYSRNKAGAYIRNRSIPINPGSARQQTVRFAVSQLSTRWVETLTAAQRAAWETYAENVQLPNPLGQSRNVGGLAMYVRSNAPRVGFPVLGSALAIVDDAPTIFDLGTFSEPVIGAISASGDTVSMSFTESDEWVGETGAALLIYSSRPQNPSVNYFKGPYQACSEIAGDDTLPPSPPQIIDLAFPVEAGQKIFFRMNVTRVDGRLSASFRGNGTAA
jgi:hypothetical protein